ncbi:two component sensor histidine kinase PhoR [Acetobacter malorum DSM 14337]|uniref:histidine kinase n=1 Tax=Acetobacter malorum DSM 14337 TaxID=1307910 RepID=A0ABQ0PRQ4_9PROT|nr:ATP-binding protein [Acetobacter malorum]GBQ78964.1 two component sensor histidine kinase PhoR [Acetobacter malorum DSM 14337]
MMHEALIAVAGILVGSGLTASLLVARVRPEKTETSSYHQEESPVSSRTAVPEGVEQVMACLPAATMVLDGERRLHYASPEALRIFEDNLGSIKRHPAFQTALDRLGEKSFDAPVCSKTARIVLDVPHHRVILARFQKHVLPATLFVGTRGGSVSSDRSQHTLVFVALYDETEADNTERQHTDFVAYASHELRTPLAALMGFVETLQGPAADDPEAQQEFLGIMAAQGKRMQHLLDDLLYLSRVQRVEHQRPRGSVTMQDLFARLKTESQALFRLKKAKLTIQSVSDPALCVAADISQLVQVLINLIENAFKYGTLPDAEGASSALQVTVSCTAASPDARWPAVPGVVLSVADNGPGIAARHLPRLTEHFYRVPKTAATVQGSGLGLAIVQHVVTRHGGRFVVESTVGKGTTCKIWLPCAASAGVIKPS